MNKTRKHPNFFDILIILLLVLVAAAAYFVSHRDSGQGQTPVVRTYTLELTDLEESMADTVAVGDQVTDNIKNYEIGTVTAVEVQPYTQGVPDEENAILRQQPTPGRIKLLVTVECPTVESEKEIATVSGYTLRTGVAVSCTIGKLTGAGYILYVER